MSSLIAQSLRGAFVGVLMTWSLPLTAYAVPIPPPGVYAEASLENQTGPIAGGPVSTSDGQPGVADVNVFTGAVNEARGRARLPGTVGSLTRLDSPGTAGVVHGRAEASQITNWKAVWRGIGPAPAMVAIDVLAVFKGSLGVSIGPAITFAGPGELVASVRAELNIYDSAGSVVAHAFEADAELDFFRFVELGVFGPTGGWSGDWTSTLGMSATGGRAEVDAFQVCRAGNASCGTTLVPVDQVFGFEVLLRTEAHALPTWAAEADFLASLEGTPMVADPNFTLVMVPEAGPSTLLGLVLVWLGFRRAGARRGAGS